MTQPLPLPAPLELVYADAHIAVANKPSGLLVHRSTRSDDKTALLQQLRDQVGRYVYPVHRIDRPTSGLVAMGLSKSMAAGLQAAMTDPQAEKVYLALLRGRIDASGITERPLTDDSGRARPARTEWRRLVAFPECSLVELRIRSGRHHQIRRHMSHLRHHVLGDTTHGKGRINRRFRAAYGLPRIFLHARQLSFAHPDNGRRLLLEAPLPDDLRACLERLPDADPADFERLL